jgi:hypothetical protein
VQKGVGALQLASLEHCTQRPCSPQTGVDDPAQSVLVKHCTQEDVIALQRIALAGHWLSVVHPERQVKDSGSQTGAATPQSALLTQLTQWSRKQRGLPLPQSEFARHSTHCELAGSQTFASRVQSADVWQPMHAPVEVSQSVAWPRVH